MDHLPAAQTDPYMGDLSFPLPVAEEKQVANFKGELDGLRGVILHVCIARDLNPEPTMQQAREPGTVNAIAACATPKIGDTDHTHCILDQRCAFFLSCFGYFSQCAQGGSWYPTCFICG